ncbi:MAG: hypothetical protein QMD95_00835 [Candidatus Hodarchaeaceae archaeon]|nr:hypothetical protein [Candidatus Hodarchaeaceae archaeon]
MRRFKRRKKERKGSKKSEQIQRKEFKQMLEKTLEEEEIPED